MTGTDPTRVLLVRHGETDWNRVARIQGHMNIGLNARGHEQARLTGEALRDAGLDAIVSSDLARARDTAAAIAQATGLALVLDPCLRERSFGDYEGQSHVDILAGDPQEAALWQQRDPDFEPRGGESLRRFHGRAVACVQRLAARHAGQQVALVSHGGVLDAVYRAATQVPIDAPRQWRIDNASIHRVLAHGEQLVLLHWGDTAHLEGLALDDATLDAGESSR